jgi:alpha-1,6-mannosyltransferase
MRIVQLANFIHETSGGIRTAIDALSERYVATGHEVMRISPGSRYHLHRDGQGRTIVTLPGTPLPTSGGYRLLLRRGPLASVIASWRPDVIEVSDKTTLSWVGGLAHDLGAASVLMSHERLDLVMGDHLPAPRLMHRLAGWHQRRLVHGFDLVVCASHFAAAEFDGVELSSVAVVPLGVDLDLFHPDRRFGLDRDRTRPRVMMVSRLTREKQPSLALTTLRELQRRGRDVELLVAGDGSLLRAMTDAAVSLGATMLGHVTDRQHLAALVADADAVLSPGRRETFGLAALEALACGTPIVAVDEGALPELLAPGAGVTKPLDPVAFADGVEALLAGDRCEQRRRARARAEEFTWQRSAATLLHHYSTIRRRGERSARMGADRSPLTA